MPLSYFGLPGVDKEPVVEMRYWRLMEWSFPEEIKNGEVITFIYGEEADFGLARRSTPIVSIEKHDGSDFEWAAITESGRKYVLSRAGEKGMGRDMNQMECDLYDDAERNNIKLRMLSLKEWVDENLTS